MWMPICHRRPWRGGGGRRPKRTCFFCLETFQILQHRFSSRLLRSWLFRIATTCNQSINPSSSANQSRTRIA
jgi:hypothetical protein